MYYQKLYNYQPNYPRSTVSMSLENKFDFYHANAKRGQGKRARRLS